MAQLRSFAAIAVVASLLLATAGTATAASSVKATGPARAIALPGLPGLPGLPVIDFGFDCFAPFLGDAAAQVSQLETNKSIVILTNTQNPTPSFLDVPSMFTGSGWVDVMKCYFTYPAGTIPGAPFTMRDFYCTYTNDRNVTSTNNGNVFHVFGESMLIVRDTWALMVCLGSGVLSDSAPSAGSGRL